MKILIIISLLIISILAPSQENKTIVKSEIKEVTLYLKGANIIRRASVDINQGNNTIIFANLSDDIDPDNIQIGVDNENIKINSINFQYNYFDSIRKSKELNELKNKLKIIEENIKIEDVKLRSIEEELTFLRENRIIGGKNEPLTITSYRDIYNFYSERIKTLLNQQNESNKKLEILQQEQANIINQINQIENNKSIKRTGEIVVNLFSKLYTKANFTISYYIQKASWFPQYDVSVKSITEKVDITLKANIYQNTGEDWNNVKLKLVSTDPAIGNILPKLKTYYLDYNTRPPTYKIFNNKVSGYVKDAYSGEPLTGVNVVVKGTSIGTITNSEGYYSITLPDEESLLSFTYIGYEDFVIKPDRSYINVNLRPIESKISEVYVKARGLKATKSDEKLEDLKSLPIREQSSIDIASESKTYYEYEINTPCTIKSENKSNFFEIDNFKIDAIYEYNCIPKIDKDAFLIARLINWENYNLLTGEANMFFENTYVGKSVINPASVSDTINLSFGRDKNIVVKREKVKAQTTKQIIGNKKEELRIWKIEVKNNKKFPVNLILYDQVPISQNSEIEVIVDNTSGGFLNKENGEVKWNIKLEPYQIITFELKYRVKYPKEKTLYIE